MKPTKAGNSVLKSLFLWITPVGFIMTFVKRLSRNYINIDELLFDYDNTSKSDDKMYLASRINSLYSSACAGIGTSILCGLVAVIAIYNGGFGGEASNTGNMITAVGGCFLLIASHLFIIHNRAINKLSAHAKKIRGNDNTLPAITYPQIIKRWSERDTLPKDKLDIINRTVIASYSKCTTNIVTSCLLSFVAILAFYKGISDISANSVLLGVAVAFGIGAIILLKKNIPWYNQLRICSKTALALLTSKKIESTVEKNIYYFKAYVHFYLFTFFAAYVFYLFLDKSIFIKLIERDFASLTIGFGTVILGTLILASRALISYKDIQNLRKNNASFSLRGCHNISDNINIIYFHALFCLFVFLSSSKLMSLPMIESLTLYPKAMIKIFLWAYVLMVSFGLARTFKNFLEMHSIPDGKFSILSALLGQGMYLPIPSGTKTSSNPNDVFFQILILVVSIFLLNGDWSHIIAFSSILIAAAVMATTYHIRVEVGAHNE